MPPIIVESNRHRSEPAVVSNNPSTVDELLNYRLARLLAATSAPGIRLLEGQYGVRRRAWGLLGLIVAYGPISPSELASRSHHERAKVSLNVTALVADGLLHRDAMPGDRRRALLNLTDKGRALFDEVYPQLAELVRSVCLRSAPSKSRHWTRSSRSSEILPP